VISALCIMGVVGTSAPPTAPPTAESDRAPQTHAAAASTVADSADSVTQVEMRNVDFYVDPEIVLHIHRLRGTMRSKTPGPVLFDDRRSFILHMTSAEVGLTGSDLTTLLNKYVFAYPGAQLRHLRVTVGKSEIVQTGDLHKVVDLPFTIHATLSVTPDGRIRIHPTRTDMMGLHVDGLMHGLGLSLSKLLDLSKAKGASVNGNDIYLIPDRILPPPTIEGHVTAVRIQDSEVVQTFGDDGGGPSRQSPLRIPDPAAPNFMFYSGGTVRFGKLLMLDTEMQIVDLDPADPFRFDLSRYNSQLIAGYSRTLPDLGLEVFMRDIDKVTGASVARTTGQSDAAPGGGAGKSPPPAQHPM
jgi:hypothetical protein